MENGQYLLGVLQERDALQFFGGNFLGDVFVNVSFPLATAKDGVGQKACSQQVANYFRALGNEESFALTVLFQFERTNELYLVFANHAGKVTK